MKRAAALVPLLAALSLINAADGVIAITGATIVDGTGAPPVSATVLIRGERIAEVGPSVQIPSDARIIDASGLTLIPGIFDVHTHLHSSGETGVPGDWARNLRRYLYHGITSVVDFGSYPEMFEPMRRLLREGITAGPRLILAARVTTPGGHGAEGGRGDFHTIEVLTPREAREAIRRVLPSKPDVIKAFTDGWRYNTAPDMTSMDQATLSALVEDAHASGLRVLTHTVTLEKAKVAARAGVDTIAHGVGDTPVDEELIGLMKAKSVTYAPTLAVFEPRPRARQPFVLTIPTDNAPRSVRWAHLMHNTKALQDGAIRLATGTDAGVTGTSHATSTLRELQLLVAGGLTPVQAIAAATGNSAAALHVADRGTIAPGKLADLVLIDGAPHSRIEEIERVKHVFLGGREIDRVATGGDLNDTKLTPMPARGIRPLVDDFESADGRTSLGTLRVNSYDPGHDHSRMIFGRILRGAGNHALSISATMSQKERPFVRLDLPLTPGAIEPANTAGFHGVRFDARGDGQYRVLTQSRLAEDYGLCAAPFDAGVRWRTVTILFSALTPASSRNRDCTTANLLMLEFEIARPAGQFAWLELDNVRFF